MTPRIFVRTYEELKREVTSGRYKPGQRLQARSLADALRTSTSPVTQAMRQLVGEAILEYTAEDGFIIPWVTEQRLRDLVSASVWLTSTGLDDVEQKAPKSDPEDVVPSEIDVVRGTERLFRVIVDRMQNAELSRWLDNTNDRLRTIRQLERHLVPDRVDELMALDKLWTDGSRLALRRGLTRYHKRRFDLIPQLIGLSYQDRH